MTAFAFAFVVMTEICAVIGQIFFKHAMSGSAETMPRPKFILTMAAGITAMAVNFFLWQGLLSKFPLSYIYPFDGINRIMLVIAASVFLKEKMTLGLWVGVVLICAGILLVSAS